MCKCAPLRDPNITNTADDVIGCLDELKHDAQMLTIQRLQKLLQVESREIIDQRRGNNGTAIR